MGEVTAHYTTHESMYNTNDSHMYEVDRDALSKARIELDSACTTIKNLSEAVVNFSCNKNMLAPIQDKEEYTPQPPSPQMAPLANIIPASRWTKSTNPAVIKPTWNTTSKSSQPTVESTPKLKANPHHLILQFNPSILEPERRNVDLACRDINNLLDSLEEPTYFRVMVVNWSRNGNPVITTTASCTAGNLLSHADKIGKIFTDNTLVSALPDIKYFQLKVNMISMKD